MSDTKWIYAFGGGTAEGSAEMRDLLGGKGANLAEMSSLGLPVPPGFTISTEVCTAYTANNNSYPNGVDEQVSKALAAVEDLMGHKFGDPKNPLLVSVRSGARASMPGMMDTVLNLGLNDETVEGLAEASGDPRFAYDSYRRFIQMYGDVVLGVEHHLFEEILGDLKDEKGVDLDTELGADDWKKVAKLFAAKVEEEIGKPFPQDPKTQLWGAIDAVFGSWMNDRAKIYRRLQNIPESWGTAVNVQAMDFGDRGVFHPEPVDRRRRLLRRVSHQRPGRGCGRRHSHTAGADNRGKTYRARRRDRHGGIHARGIRRAVRYPGEA